MNIALIAASAAVLTGADLWIEPLPSPLPGFEILRNRAPGT
jgi:hypothetical protein